MRHYSPDSSFKSQPSGTGSVLHGESKNSGPRLLVFNCHEAWVYQLADIPFQMDILVGLKGRYKNGWDEQMRPVPPNARLVALADALHSEVPYHCIIAHNIQDLLDVKFLSAPRLLVIHSTLEGRQLEEGTDLPPASFSAMARRYVEITGAYAVACSVSKGRSWGISQDVVPFGVDPAAYPPHTGEIGAGLRVCNFIRNRRKILLWDFHDQAFQGLPVRLVGHNPGMPGVTAAANWEKLKGIFQSHRFYIHTADPRYEDGYNMATLEAMAAGLPVLGNRHPTSPIADGVDGFLSDSPSELRSRAGQLLSDPDLAWRMGQAARQTAIRRFPEARFQRGILRAIQNARSTWEKTQQAQHSKTQLLPKA